MRQKRLRRERLGVGKEGGFGGEVEWVEDGTWDTMKWLTLKSSARRCMGRSLSTEPGISDGGKSDGDGDGRHVGRAGYRRSKSGRADSKDADGPHRL